MSNVMDWLGLDRFPQPPNVKAGQVRPGTGTLDPSLPKWLRQANVYGTDTPQQVPVGRGHNFEAIRRQLSHVGLSWRVADWVLHLVREGASPGEIEQRLYDHPEFQSRFKPIFDREAQGLNSPHPSEIVAWERQAEQIMRAANMPARFYDHWSDYQTMITAGWSVQQLAERVDGAYLRVAQAPRVVRDAFAELYGPAGDAALAAITLDPEKAMPALQREIAAAEATGAGMTFGFQLQRRDAEAIAARGFDYSSSLERFSGLGEVRGLFSDTISEAQVRGAPEVNMETGVEAVFGLEGAGEASEAIRRREQERQAAFGGSGGPQGTSTTGAAGLGSAE